MRELLILAIHPLVTLMKLLRPGGARRRRRMQTALASDVSAARDVLSKKLGSIVVEKRNDGVYAQMDIGPVLLQAAGADVSKTGCGGAQPVLATPNYQALNATIVIRLGDCVTRRSRGKPVSALGTIQ